MQHFSVMAYAIVLYLMFKWQVLYKGAFLQRVECLYGFCYLAHSYPLLWSYACLSCSTERSPFCTTQESDRRACRIFKGENKKKTMFHYIRNNKFECHVKQFQKPIPPQGKRKKKREWYLVLQSCKYGITFQIEKVPPLQEDSAVCLRNTFTVFNYHTSEKFWSYSAITKCDCTASPLNVLTQ